MKQVMTQGRILFLIAILAGLFIQGLPVSADPQPVKAQSAMGPNQVPQSAQDELKKARLIGWSNYSSYIYNRVNEAYQDGLTQVDPADLWTNYTCVSLANVLADLGKRERANVDIVMRTHLISGNVFIIQDGAVRQDPNSFSGDEMYALVSLMTERFMGAAKQDPTIVKELEVSFDGCASSLHAESRAIK